MINPLLRLQRLARRLDHRILAHARPHRRHLPPAQLELIDLFGDRIKAVDPELFDFARIEWLDVRAMQEAAHLHYDQVVQSSLLAMRKINDSINQRAKQSLEGFNNGIGAGLISLGLNFVGHHLDSIAITHELRAELENFKLRLHSDATTVQTDVMRLFTIYKALNASPSPAPKNSTSLPIASSITASKPSSTPTTTAAT